MKRPLQLPLAIALALGGTNAFALGLGTIHVNSKLNQPLDAEIPVLQGTQGEAEGLLVQLAAAEDFDRVGLNRSRLSVPLEFSLVKNPRGEMVIKVTSKEVVREPFLDFLVEANWPKGRLLREYTVLLDPPVMAPATGAAAVAQAPKATERPAAAPPAEKPKAAPPPPKPAPVAVAPRPEKPAPAPKAAPPAPAPKAAGANEYTVQEGDTLSGIAREMKPDESTNINALMLALLKQNPNAFYKDNINALKRGAILRIPSSEQIKSVGSASEAAAMVHAQIEDWRGGAAAKPTLVADTGSAPEPKAKPATKPSGTSSTASTTPKTGSERLELVPPKAGKDSVAMNDRPGSGGGSGSAQSNEIKAELARTKEALAAREQEAGELKSRVKELEDTKGKSDRLITLKDSEIADLQKKLRELQDQSKSGAKTVATTPPSTPAATTPPATTSSTGSTPATPPPATGKTDGKVSKEDIWGTTAPTADGKTPGATPPPTPATGSTASSTTPTTPSTTPATVGTTTPSTTTATPTATTGTGAAATSSSGGTTTPSATPSSTASTTTPPTTPSSGTTPPSTTGSSSTTPSTTTTTPAASTSTSTPAKPAATTTPVKTAKTTTTALPPSTPAWYEQAWVKPAAIGAAALLLLAGLLSMRRRKAAATAVERGSIAGAFGDSPLRDDGGAAIPIGGEEQALRDQIENDPSNLGLHLELLSLLYAERHVAAFEDAAETMHAHVTDPHQPEWLEVKAMGQELAPHNALFADEGAMHAFDDEAVTARHAAATFDDDDSVFHTHHEAATPAYEPLTPPPAQSHANTAFDFDLDAGAPAPKTTTAPAAATEPPFAFDNLPPIDFGKEAEHEFEAAAPAAPLSVDEDEFAGEDGVGTKLDLAKAYLDMGDPEGARSMLEEVLSEGNDSQKGEARRLMAEIR